MRIDIKDIHFDAAVDNIICVGDKVYVSASVFISAVAVH